MTYVPVDATAVIPPPVRVSGIHKHSEDVLSRVLERVVACGAVDAEAIRRVSRLVTPKKNTVEVHLSVGLHLRM